MGFGGIGGLGTGFAQGLAIGDKVNSLIQEDQIAKVRAQGIAEAQAAAAAGTPQVQDQGDVNNLTSRPQASTDPAAAPVNTSLAASPAMQGVTQTQADGMSTAPVAAPDAGQDTTKLSSTPLASAGEQAAPAGGVTIKGGKRFMVGDQGFDDLASAQAHAKSQAPDLYEIMRKTVLPRERDTLMAQGQYDKAAALDKWGQEEDGRAYMKTYSKLVQAVDSGDDDSALKHIQDLHKRLNDGLTVSSITDAKDEKGNVIGKSVTYKNDATGQESTQVVDPQALIKMGMAGLSPEKAFALDYQAKTSADALRAKAQYDAQNDARTAQRQQALNDATTKRDVYLEALRQKGALTLADRQSANRTDEKKTEIQMENGQIAPKLNAQVEAKINLLRASGYSDSDIKDAIPQIIGIDDKYKKTTDPEERRAIVTTELIKNPIFTTKSKAEQEKMVDQYVGLMQRTPKAGKGTPAADDGETPAPKPAAAGVSRAAAPAKGAVVPLTMYDPVSKTMVPVVRR